MTLTLVWSNPSPLTHATGEIRRIMKGEYGSVYLVSYPDGDEEFELTRGQNQYRSAETKQPQSA